VKFHAVASGDGASRWDVVVLGEVLPRVARSREQAYRWARNLCRRAPVVVRSPSGVEEVVAHTEASSRV
jgi:hypothetical protein